LQPNIDLIKENHYDYVKVWVSPFDNLRYKERNYTGPKSINRDLILNSLLDIYENWDLQLKQLNIPYYLKIWIYEPRITSSQIVCGIEDRIKHYADIFSLATTKMQFPLDRYKALQNRINMLIGRLHWMKKLLIMIFGQRSNTKKRAIISLTRNCIVN